MRAVRVVSVTAVLALLALLVWDLAHSDRGNLASKVDKGQTVTAPALQLPRLGSAGDLSLAAYRGKVVVVNFWASWCVDCKLEAKTLAAAASRWRGKDVVFVGVDSKDLGSAARGYVSRYRVDYPVARDGSGSESDRWGVTGYPETFFVDRTGQVVPPHVSGPITPALLDSSIRHALAS